MVKLTGSCLVIAASVAVAGCRPGVLILDERTQGANFYFGHGGDLAGHEALYKRLPVPVSRETVREDHRSTVQDLTFAALSRSPEGAADPLPEPIRLRQYMEEAHDGWVRMRLYYLGHNEAELERLRRLADPGVFAVVRFPGEGLPIGSASARAFWGSVDEALTGHGYTRRALSGDTAEYTRDFPRDEPTDQFPVLVRVSLQEIGGGFGEALITAEPDINGATVEPTPVLPRGNDACRQAVAEVADAVRAAATDSTES